MDPTTAPLLLALAATAVFLLGLTGLRMARTDALDGWDVGDIMLLRDESKKRERRGPIDSLARRLAPRLARSLGPRTLARIRQRIDLAGRPQGMTVDKFLRAIVGVTLFTSAYMAEVVRGGLQAIPRGQYEAASALGLGYWQRMWFIILPQALKHVIPGIVNNFISLFKDTSLVSVIGLFDLLQMAKVVQSQTEWLGIAGGVWRETLFFVATIYFIFSFAMSRVSLRIERSLGVGHR